MKRELEALQLLEARLRQLADCVRLLPNLTPDNAAEERARLIASVARGDKPTPTWRLRVRRPPLGTLQALDMLRRGFERLPGAALYQAKLDELELELALVDAIGHPRRVRPLAARRFGRGCTTPVAVHPTLQLAHRAPGDRALRVDLSGCETLAAVARRLLDQLEPASEERALLPADGPRDVGSAAAVFRAVALAAGLDVQVRVDPRLAARAASGDRVVFLADRPFGRRETLRLAAHEVLGHLVAAANGRAQPLRLLELGTADAFADQEGLAICLEEASGLLDRPRLRTLAARVAASDWMHEGADFGETAWRLVQVESFGAADAVAIAERAYRGGGVARDSAYLAGWLRVRRAFEDGAADIDRLRMGRVSLQALPEIERLIELKLARRAIYRPNLARILSATESGTMPVTLPPSDAASFTRLELT